MLDRLHQTHFPIGLDVSQATVKAFQFGHNSHKQIVIKGFSKIALPKGVIVDDTILDSETLSYIVSQALNKTKYGSFSGSRIALSLPESKSFVRVIHLPHMSDTEVDSAIPFEAESYIPIPIDQVYLDWQKLSEINHRMEILLIATPKENADKLLNVFDKLKLTPQVLEVESQSVERALIPKSGEESCLIVDMNDHRTNLVAIEKSKLQMTSSIPMGGTNFSEALAKQMGVKLEKAEELKLAYGLNNTPDNPNIKLSMLPVLKNLAAEIKSILDFESQHFQVSAKKVLLCGGGARLKGFQENLVSELEGLQLELGNPFINTTTAFSQNILPLEESLEYTTAIGLSLRTEY